MSRSCSGALTRLLAAIFACVLFGAVGLVGQARAATYTVAVANDSNTSCPLTSNKCSLRELINDENALTTAPNPPDTIVVPAGGYDLTLGQLTISQSVNIVGAGAQNTDIYQETTSGTSRVFSIQPNAKVNANPNVTISGLAMYFGEADSTNGYYGGDVLNQGTLTLSEDLVADGEAVSGSGAGISNKGGTLTVDHSLVWQNESTNPNGGGDSGGIQNYGDDSVGAATLNVVDSTIADNDAALGPGIFSWCAGSGGECSTTGATNSTTIVNSTIADNTGGSRGATGGGLLASQGTISVENSILADNTAVEPTGAPDNSNCGASSPGAITSLGYNIDSGTDCGFDSTGDQSNTDPGFLTGGLAYNGGNTETFALSGTSPAVDAIPHTAPGCSGTDQRDFTRPQGTGCDVGAYELFQPIVGVQSTWVLGQVGATVATVNWGDGASSQASVTSSGVVTGTHTYAAPGVYHAEINWNNSDGRPDQTPFDVVVQDAPISATGGQVSAVAGTQFSGAVATFTDQNPDATASQFSATINWGDGTRPTGGTVATNPNGGFVVDGTHTYAATGSYTTTIGVADAGGSTASTTGLATVSPPGPTVTQVSPSSGPSSGGTTVTVTGTNFTNATAVKFGTSSATSFTVNSATQITATAPPEAAGTVDITVTSPGGTSGTGAADQYTFVARPAVSNVSPSGGLTTGGTSVTVTGTNFTNATAVTFGTTEATSFTVDGATQIVATAPAESAGTVDITVTTLGGTSATSSADQYTYGTPPTVTQVNPSSGPTAAGTSVTIIGTNFAGATAVQFGSTPAGSFETVSPTQINAVAPAGTGTVDVTVTTPNGGTSATSSADQYSFVAAPTVTNVSPATGPTTGGKTVTITGTNFTNATAIRFGSTSATRFTVNSATSITATAPAGSAGTVDITVTTIGGTSATTATDQYTFQAPPTASIASPATNQTFNQGQIVPTTFSCTEGASGPGIQSCVDSNGGSGGTGTLNTSTAGPHSYTVTATSKDGQTSAATINYTVIGPPTATISAPANNGTYNLNQSVGTSFSCTEGANGSGIQSCKDSNGATNGTGSFSTATAGAHTYTVTATSKDGQTGTATINYTVIGPPAATISAPANNKTYNLGQTVATTFSCAEAANGPGIQTCKDSNGASTGTGSLNTGTAGQFTYTVTATSKDGQTGTATINYSVAAPPTATITSPLNNQTYNLNATVPTAFSCTEGANGPGIQTCKDSNGATTGTGSLSTATAGSHTYTVTATSKDGQTATKTIGYTVLAPPTATISSPTGSPTYNLNEVVPTAFSCAEATSFGGPGIKTCVDSNGATAGIGSLNTGSAGTFPYTVTATSKDGQSAVRSISYTVLSPPSAAISAPADRGTYNLGQVVPAGFSCVEGPGGPGILSCADSNGAAGAVGQLDTSSAGTHAYTVTATSKDGQTGTKTIHYTVVGPPTATISSPADNQAFDLNQSAGTSFSCAEAASGPGIKSCVDSNGAGGGAGSLDTSTVGAHSYAVTATSQDGQSSTTTINYTVSALPPAVSGGAPTGQTNTGADVSGTVNPEAGATTAYFEYGLDPSFRGPGSSTVLYDQTTPVQQVGADASVHTVTASLTGLVPLALYHVRLVATNAAGTTFGPDQTFMAAQSKLPPPPVLGQTEDVQSVSGRVFIKTPSGFVLLTGNREIRSGAEIDALQGSLEIVTATVKKGKTQHGIFGGAIFKITQERSGKHKGFATLSLIENAFKGAPGYGLCKPAHQATDATAAKVSTKTLQLLHASGHGKFTTKGRYSAATVLGTKWSIADRCDGTLVHDLTDSVLVNDFVHHRTITLHAGQSYLARAAKPGG